MHVCTGYGNQSKLFVPRIAKLGYPVSMTAFYGLQGGAIVHDGIYVMPGGRHPWGQDVMVANAVSQRADVLISLVDALVIQPERFQGSPVKWVPWFPIDCEPIKPLDLQAVKQAYKRIVFSKFALAELEKVGLDAYYVPHGVDTKVFKPVDRAKSREMLNWPADRFIVGMVAANKGFPPRKAFIEQIIAFAAFHKHHPDALLYLHTDDGSHGGDVTDLTGVLDAYGLTYGYASGAPIPDEVAVVFCDQHVYATVGFSDAYMNAAYNGMDVHMLVSAGEGFGIPIVEAQAAGCPVIVGDWTAMSELCFSGWKIPKSEATQTFTQWRTFQWYARPEAVYERLEAAYRMRGNQEYRDQARKGALAYDADKVTEKYWRPVLADISERVNAWKVPNG